jgi:hypothetical protein
MAAARGAKAHAADAGGVATFTATLTNSLLTTLGGATALTSANFQYGSGSSYGSLVAASVLQNGSTVSASATVSGLTPGGLYHYRVALATALLTLYGTDATVTASVATGGGGTGVTVGAGTGSGGGVTVGVGSTGATGSTGSTGALGSVVGVVSGLTGGDSGSGDTSTNSAPVAGASSGSTYDPPTQPALPVAPPAGDAPPQLGTSTVVKTAAGVVTVTPPGSSTPIQISSSANLPAGTVINANRGLVNVWTALDTSGHTQVVAAWSGTFKVEYAHAGHVDLVLAGGNFGSCTAAGPRNGTVTFGKRASRKRGATSKVVRSLWSSDNHGRYSTQGNDSVATVQGTEWLTQDRCDGTLTRVKRGVVAVRDNATGRTVEVRAGHSYIAR